jgi:hypothetical protein
MEWEMGFMDKELQMAKGLMLTDGQQHIHIFPWAQKLE